MIYVISMLAVSALFAVAVGVIFATLQGRTDAVVAALAGRSVLAEAVFVPAPRVRVTVSPQIARKLPPLRAAA